MHTDSVPDPDPRVGPPTQTLHFDLQLALTLQADGLQPAWRAVLLGGGPDNAMRFESMPELIRYLAQLGAGTSARGIR